MASPAALRHEPRQEKYIFFMTHAVGESQKKKEEKNVVTRMFRALFFECPMTFLRHRFQCRELKSPSAGNVLRWAR